MELKPPSIKWCWRDFNQLTAIELYQLLKLRQDVFVIEQTCLYPDIDGEDLNHKHLLGYHKNELVAYLRVIPAQFHESGCVAIGRVVTHENYRQSGLGRMLMNQAIDYCQKQYSGQTVFVSAQQYLEQFYQSLHFKTVSEMYLEDDIPHISMKLTPRNV